MNNRALSATYFGIETTDGDGVKLTRIIGTPQLNVFDPFLLFDCFESEQAQDYLGGFPEHPHRGFETVTYLLHGKMHHQDNAGHHGVIEAGGVQWMSAGRGILHSEMPAQENGLLQGFQLWVNLPAAKKMSAPNYQEISAQNIAVEPLANGGTIKVIAGQTLLGTLGAIKNKQTEPTYLDISLPRHSQLIQPLPSSHNSFVYVLEGKIKVLSDTSDNNTVSAKQLGVLGQGEQLVIETTEQPAQLLLIAGQPLNEPIARGGPFVMNTRAEVEQAFIDYRQGVFHQQPEQ